MDDTTVNGGKNERKAVCIRVRAAGRKLYKHDVMGSIAHVTMLGETDCSVRRRRGSSTRVTRVFYDVTNEKLVIPPDVDLFDFLDAELKTRVGEIGEKVNVARTRDDRIALDMRMFTRELACDLNEYVKTVIKTLVAVAEINTLTFIPFSYKGTEGQPTTAAHVFLAVPNPLCVTPQDLKTSPKKRTVCRSIPHSERIETSCRQKRVAELLRFKSVAYNTADALTDVDYLRGLLFAVSVFADHVSTLLGDIREWTIKGYLVPSEDFAVPSDVRL
ncbi:MAG: lyase family protein [Christensenellales bacterium]